MQKIAFLCVIVMVLPPLSRPYSTSLLFQSEKSVNSALLAYKSEIVHLEFQNNYQKNQNANNIMNSVIYKTLKLPVWPVWAGTAAIVADVLHLPKLSEKIVDNLGGRVVPISLKYEQMPISTDNELSPFLLLAHHTHSFTPFDPFRAITKFLLPEGFPAHPHAGFDTVTYCISGGLKHRDSEGFKMSYGDGDVQWMRAGKGVIHEEMWDLEGHDLKHKGIELFQLWVNLPTASKKNAPAVHLLRKEDMQILRDQTNSLEVRVIAGEVSLSNQENDQVDSVRGAGNSIAASPIHILHVTLKRSDRVLSVSIPEDFDSVFVYIRRGSLLVRNVESDSEEEVHSFDSVIYLPSKGRQNDVIDFPVRNSFELKSGVDGFDGLILIGKPLKERVLWRGPFVQSDEESLYEAARTFEELGNQAFWEHELDDARWKQHCERLKLQSKM